MSETLFVLQEHILTHWEELGDEEGFQCSTCGKVFGSGNQSAYVKHLATHDDEVQKACDCPTCLEDDGKKGKKRKAPPLKPINKKLRSDVLEATIKNFGETEESEENNVEPFVVGTMELAEVKEIIQGEMTK